METPFGLKAFHLRHMISNLLRCHHNLYFIPLEVYKSHSAFMGNHYRTKTPSPKLEYVSRTISNKTMQYSFSIVSSAAPTKRISLLSSKLHFLHSPANVWEKLLLQYLMPSTLSRGQPIQYILNSATEFQNMAPVLKGVRRIFTTPWRTNWSSHSWMFHSFFQ